MISVSIHEAKTNLSGLISTMERNHEPVMICRHGRAVAELLPISRASRLDVDPILKKIKILSDPTLPTEGEWENV